MQTSPRVLGLVVFLDEGGTERVHQLVLVCPRCAPPAPAVRAAELVAVDDYATCHRCRCLLAPQLRN